ncbi:MAG TPA: SDR family oxidoreductase [Acidimicrobiia bacterium]|nr:SDR family oxidoreductase [Acidimicrobiia bacterium]
MPRLDGKAAIVTGAGQGIGRGVARAFAREGAAITIAEINYDTGNAVTRELQDELGAAAQFVPTDVLHHEQVQRMVDATIDAFERVDILVNNAYVAAPFARLEQKSGDDLLLAYRGGPLHTLWAMQAVFPYMVAQGGGRIINFVSLNGINAHMYSADYNAAKEAIRALTRTAAREWARHDILVNAIAPAAATPAYVAFAEAAPENAAEMLEQNPMGRMGDPERDIGGVALFLASDDGRYVTGNTVFADGGSHINGVQWVPPMP